MTVGFRVFQGKCMPASQYVVAWGAAMLFAWLQLLSPIQQYDTDLWFHLSGGRYFFDAGELFRSSYFSFIEPVRHWVPYSWAFQVLVFVVEALSGAMGLLVLRGVLCLLTVRALFGLCLDATQDESSRPVHAGLPGAVLALVCCLALLPRELNLRPHMVSFLCLAWCLWVLETRPRWRWTLPLATLVTANMHGIEYPVFLVVLCGYVLQDVLETWRCRSRRPMRQGLGQSLWILAAMAALLLTPNGLLLLETPWQSAPFQDRIITEAMPFRWLNHMFLSVWPPRNLLLGAQTVVLASWATVLCVQGLRLRLLPSHVAQAAVAILLLTRHDRFVAEAVILAVPTLRRAVLDLGAWMKQRERLLPPRAAYAAAGGALLLASAAGFSQLTPLPHWPLSESRLPAGTARYLQAHAPAGNLLAHPDIGGYLQWALWPKRQIFVDMELSLFTAADLFAAVQALRQPTVLQGLRDRYQIDFILFPPSSHSTQLLAEFPEYVPLYVDETGVLCVDSSRHREFAEANAIRQFDPLTLEAYTPSAPGHNAIAARKELETLLEYGGENLLLRRAAGVAAMHLGDVPAAKRHALALRQAFPDRYHGLELEGLLAFREHRLDEAAALLARARDRAPESQQPRLAQYLYAVQTQAQAAGPAWTVIHDAVNPYGERVSAPELLELAAAAAATGRMRMALELLDMVEYLLSPQDAALAAQVDARRREYAARLNAR